MPFQEERLRFKNTDLLDVVVYFHSGTREASQADHCESRRSLLYIVNFKLPRAT